MSTASPTPSIEMAAQNLASTFANAWNRHDAKALADCFVEDGDIINPAGRVAIGRHEIEALFADEHSGSMKTSEMSQTVTRVRVLAPDLAVATNHCQITGMRNPATGQTVTISAIATMVLRNEARGWRVVAARPMVPVTPPK